MAQVGPCPEDARLRELLLGQLDDPHMEQLGDHLLSCEQCAVRAGTLQAADELTLSLRASDTLLPDENDPLVQRLASRLHHLRVMPEPPRLGDQTLSLSSPTEASLSAKASASVAPDGKSQFTFLGLPQAGDEIGRLGAYRVLKVLGQGGMGVVFQAEDTRLGRLCALKAMLPEVAAKPGMKERFLREARAAAQIEHDHIIPIYQVDEDRGVPFIAMPFLKGMALEDWIRKQANSKPGGASIPAPVIVRLGRQIAKGLAAAHQQGLVHRDIKPANLWLDSSAGGRVKILDFGLARLGEAVDQQNLTQTGLILGTPSYMAPEQARGDKLDGRADLFSLGVILYRLATGVLPFTGKDSMATLMALATHTPQPPHTINPAIPRSLSALIMQLLAKEPAQRVRSAQDVIAALQTVEKDLTSNTAEEAVPTAGSRMTSEIASSGTAANSPRRLASISAGWPKSGRWPRSYAPLIACGTGAAALLLAGIIFFWQSPHGTIRIEINDPSITAQIDANGVDITKAGERVVRLQPGPHGLRIKQGQLEFETDKFILAKGEIVDLKVERLAGEIRVTADEKLIGSKQLPVADTVASREQRTISATGDAEAKKTPETPQFAIRLDEKRQISNRSFKVDVTRPFTLEAWITPVRNDTEWAGLIRISPVVGLSIKQGVDGMSWYFAMGSDSAARARLGPANRQSLHVACVRTDEELILYLNGRVEARADVPSELVPTEQSLAIGDVTARPYEIWMDEIRISQVARYKKEFTPDKLFEPDDDTLALYHCDEGSGQVLNDASGNGYHCQTDGAKWVMADAESESEVKLQQSVASAPEQSHDLALRFDETTQIWMKNLSVDLTRPFTLEAWVTPWRSRFPDGCGLVRLRTSVGLRIGGWSPDPWCFHIGAGEPVVSQSSVRADVRVHVAGVRTPTESILYLDGRVAARMPVEAGPFPKDLDPTLGYMFVGTLNEIRISTVARYTKEFTPAKRFEPDEATLALYHCDEGSGDLLTDASGNGYHCDINRADWVDADATSENERRSAQPNVTTPPKPQRTSILTPSRLGPSDAGQASALQKAWAQHLGVPLEFENSVGMKFRLVPPGQLTLGTSAADIEQYIAQAEAAGRHSFTIQFLKAEGPQREVSFDEPFYLGIHEVTQEVWQRVMGDNPSANKSEADLPVENVTWLDALRFCSRLSEHERLPPNYKVEGDRAEHVGTHGYRLPSRDEWEYACRAGSSTRYSFGDDATLLKDYAWFKDNSSGRTHPVGLKLPNPFGLFDMHGNVNELVQPNENAAMNYKFQQQRGGTYESEADFNRSSIIGSCLRDKGGAWAGFRVVLSLDTSAVRTAGLRDQPPAAVGTSQNRSPVGERTASVYTATASIPKIWTLRTIAEWSIAMGGKVLLGEGHVVSQVEQLPAKVDRLDLVDFSGLKSFGDDEAKIAGSWPTIKGIAVAGTSITDDGLRHLAALPMGNSFSAADTVITGEGFDDFREKPLGTISLASCQLSDQGWRNVARIGATGQWHLQFSNLNDAALAQIVTTHPEIETLNASCRDVTDTSAATIATASGIRTLVLNTTGISDEGLKKLAGLKRLKTLHVKETEVTAAGVEQLRRALPDCTIEWK